MPFSIFYSKYEIIIQFREQEPPRKRLNSLRVYCDVFLNAEKNQRSKKSDFYLRFLESALSLKVLRADNHTVSGFANSHLNAGMARTLTFPSLNSFS